MVDFVIVYKLYNQNKNERKVDRRADTLDLDTCVERISRYMKGEYVGIVATTYQITNDIQGNKSS